MTRIERRDLADIYLRTHILPFLRPVEPQHPHRQIFIEVECSAQMPSFERWGQEILREHAALHAADNLVARSTENPAWSWRWCGFEYHPLRDVWEGELVCWQWEAAERGELTPEYEPGAEENE